MLRMSYRRWSVAIGLFAILGASNPSFAQSNPSAAQPNPRSGLRSGFDRQLEATKDDVLRLGAMVEQAIEGAGIAPAAAQDPAPEALGLCLLLHVRPLSVSHCDSAADRDVNPNKNG